MKRLAAMQLWPLFCMRAVTPTSTALAMSAEGMTMKGSEPPSSSTVFLISEPAVDATAEPAPSLPVRVAARTRLSLRIPSTLEEEIRRVWKTPCGASASRKMRSISSAHWLTLEACFRMPTLPAMIAGAAKRMHCQ